MEMKSKKIHFPGTSSLSSTTLTGIFIAYAAPIIKTATFQETKNYIQHGDTSCFSHCISVAYYSLKIADWLSISYDTKSLISGALLHDYFLYDWHQKDNSHRLHGFTHPKKSLYNAMRDFDLNTIEQNIIERHMFPLTPIPPRYRESVIVCLADKFCSLAETLHIDMLPLSDHVDVWHSDENNDNE